MGQSEDEVSQGVNHCREKEYLKAQSGATIYEFLFKHPCSVGDAGLNKYYGFHQAEALFRFLRHVPEGEPEETKRKPRWVSPGIPVVNSYKPYHLRGESCIPKNCFSCTNRLSTEL